MRTTKTALRRRARAASGARPRVRTVPAVFAFVGLVALALPSVMLVPAPASAAVPPPARVPALAPAHAIKAARTRTSVTLTWVNPHGADFTGVMVRRAVGSVPPRAPHAGTLVRDVARPGSSVTDTGLVAGATYSYALFAHDAARHFAAAATITVTTRSGKPPVNVVRPAITGSATVGSTVSLSTGSWNRRGLAYSYQWSRCRYLASATTPGGWDFQGPCAAVPGATSAAYAVTLADLPPPPFNGRPQGTLLTAAVTATNAGGAGATAVTFDAGSDPSAANRQAGWLTTPGVFDARAYGAAGDGVTDDTAAVQRALDAAGVDGGIVLLPAGQYRMGGSVSVPAGVTLAGVGWRAPGVDATTGFVAGTVVGTWVVVSAGNAGNPLQIVGKGGAIRDLAIRHEQPRLDTPGWQPANFGAAIRVVQTDALIANVMLLNPTDGIRIDTGRVTLDGIRGQPLHVGLRIDNAADVVRVDDLTFSPAFWTANPAATNYSQQAGSGIDVFHADNAQFSHVEIDGYANGLYFGTNGSGLGAHKFLLFDAQFANVGVALDDDSADDTTRISIANTSVAGATTGLFVSHATTVTASAFDLRALQTNAIRVQGGGRVLVDHVTIADWALGGAPYPAIEAAANARADVGVHRTFTTAGTQTGGAGTVQLYDTGLDLGIASPSAAPGILPLALGASASVRDFGARGDGVADDTGAVQAALDAAATAGGGVVWVPGGEYRLTRQVRVPAGVTLRGVGWQGEFVPGDLNADGTEARHFKGSYFQIDASETANAFVVADRATIRDLAVRDAQPPIGAGAWQPGNFGWSFVVKGTAVDMNNILLYNPTRGIRVESTGSGLVRLDRIFGQPLTVGLELDTTATVRVNEVHFWQFWACNGDDRPECGTRAAAVDYTTRGGTGINMLANTNAELSNVLAIDYGIGLYFGRTTRGATQGLDAWNVDFDDATFGIYANAAGATATIGNWNAQGRGDTPNCSESQDALVVTAPKVHLGMFNGDLFCFARGITVSGSGAVADVDLLKLGFVGPSSGATIGPLHT